MLVAMLQAYENNGEMKLRARRQSTEELQAPVIDKVCELTLDGQILVCFELIKVIHWPFLAVGPVLF